ncbi:MAG: hypothetical protein ACREJT_15395 [Myxococcota bacterium]
MERKSLASLIAETVITPEAWKALREQPAHGIGSGIGSGINSGISSLGATLGAGLRRVDYRVAGWRGALRMPGRS